MKYRYFKTVSLTDDSAALRKVGDVIDYYRFDGKNLQYLYDGVEVIRKNYKNFEWRSNCAFFTYNFTTKQFSTKHAFEEIDLEAEIIFNNI